jgi:large subunit ribosomal protein L5
MNNSRLERYYNDVGKKELKKYFKLDNIMKIPKLQKISINSSSKEAVINNKVIDKIYNEITAITGQKPVLTKAKKSIAAFKLRQGMTIGCKVTLRKNAMYEFLDKLVNVVLPRVRDFKGLNAENFDSRGNISLGIREQIAFPEINYDQIEQIRGMNITIVTSATNDEEAKFLLKIFNLPFYN